MASYTTDTTLSSNLSDGESITVSNGATLTIDAGTFIPTMSYGAITSTKNGTVRFENSTSDVMVVNFSAITNNIRIEGASKFEAVGDFVSIGTSNGTANQSFDVSQVGTNSVSLDNITCLWVRDTSTGEYTPWSTLGDPSLDDRAFDISSPADANKGQTGFGGVGGTNDNGRFFQYDRTNQSVTFGDGTNGAIPPSGDKIFINNIQFTAPYNGVFSNRCEFDLNSGGTIELSNADLNDRFYTSFRQARKVDFNYVSSAGKLIIRDVYEEISLTNYCMTPDINRTSEYYPYLQIETPLTTVDVSDCSFNVDMGVSNNRNAHDIDFSTGGTFKNIWMNIIHKENGNHRNSLFFNMDNLDTENVNLIGGGCTIQNSKDTLLKSWRHSATPFEPTNITSNINVWRNIEGILLTSVCSGITIFDFQQFSWGCPPWIAVQANETVSELEIYDLAFDAGNVSASSWCIYGIRVFGKNSVIKNCTLNGGWSTAVIEVQLDASNTKIDNVVSDTSNTSNVNLNTSIFNMIEGGLRTDNIGSSIKQDLGLVLRRNIGLGSSNGIIHMGGGDGTGYEFEITGDSYYLNNSLAFVSLGDTYVVGTKSPMRGFTGFDNSSARINGSGMTWNEVQLSFKMAKAGDDLPTSFTDIDMTGASGADFNVYSDLNAAFNALTGYDSDEGLQLVLKLEKTVTGSATDTVIYINVPCAIDSSYQAVNASINFAGGSDTEKYEICKASDDSVLYTFIGTGSHDLVVGSNLGESIYVKRYTDTGSLNYVLVASTQVSPQTIILGDNGTVLLYTGAEVQVASGNPEAVWSYSERTLTASQSGLGFTATDRDQLNKALTTGKFLALK